MKLKQSIGLKPGKRNKKKALHGCKPVHTPSRSCRPPPAAVAKETILNDGLWVGFVKLVLYNAPDTHQLFLSRARWAGRGLCELLPSELLLGSRVWPWWGWCQAPPEHRPEVLHWERWKTRGLGSWQECFNTPVAFTVLQKEKIMESCIL